MQISAKVTIGHRHKIALRWFCLPSFKFPAPLFDFVGFFTLDHRIEPLCSGHMSKQPPKRYLAIKVVMMPRDTNPYGTIFGGVILSYIDQAGAVGARHEIAVQGFPAQPLVTVAMEGVEFREPVFVGDTLSFWTLVRRIGDTSITMHVTVEAEREGQARLLTQAEVTYVAVALRADERKPVPIRGGEDS
jgi:acyl-CoA thioesterase YciA